jgi:hypothetical protein
MRHGWPKIELPGAGNAQPCSHFSRNDKLTLLLDGSGTGPSPGRSPLDNQIATVFVMTGASMGLKHELTKPKTSIGQAGGGADIEINESQASAMHCVLAASKDGDMLRLYDLGSENRTYVDNQRVQVTNLGHCSEFRIGSTVFLVTIVSKHSAETIVPDGADDGASLEI